MFRLIGAICIIGATATVGLASVLKMGRRVQALSSLVTALEVMRGEICDRMTPMPELMELMEQDTQGPAALLFKRVRQGLDTIGTRSFYFIWKSAVENSRELELTAQESKTLIDLGHVLGRYDTEEQRGALLYAGRRLEGFLRRAEEDKRQQGKVHAAMGLAAGVFVVIILL